MNTFRSILVLLLAIAAGSALAEGPRASHQSIRENAEKELREQVDLRTKAQASAVDARNATLRLQTSVDRHRKDEVRYFNEMKAEKVNNGESDTYQDLRNRYESAADDRRQAASQLIKEREREAASREAIARHTKRILQIKAKLAAMDKQSPKGKGKVDPPKGSQLFGLVEKKVGHASGPIENEGARVVGSITESSFTVTVTKKAPWVGTTTITHTWSGALGATLKPDDVIELTCTSTASHSGKHAELIGSVAEWVVTGNGAEVLEGRKKSFGGQFSNGWSSNGSGVTRFKVKHSGTITIYAKHGGYAWGGSDNWVPATYVYEYGKRPKVGGG